MPLPELDPIRPGDVLLGKYRVERILGRGGMGVVVGARHLTLDDRVAIKFLLPDHVGDAQLVQRFLREARAAVRICSQHVARVTDVGTMESGAPYMVMEHLEGKNLAALITESGRVPIPVAIELVLQACEALAEAHAQGIVHRDVKPSNLFLTRFADGAPCVKVLDFGIAKMQSAQDHALTRTGGVLGSPLYMSPEQLRSSRDVDARADVYSVGVVLFELLTARVPFMGEELAQLVYKIMNDEPIRPCALRGDIPEGLERAILTAIARDRDARFANIADLAVALAPFAPSHAQRSVERISGVLRPRDGALLEAPPPQTTRVDRQQLTARLDDAPKLADSATLTSIAPLRFPERPADQPARRSSVLTAALGVVLLTLALVTWRQVTTGMRGARTMSGYELREAASASANGAPEAASSPARAEPTPPAPATTPEMQKPIAPAASAIAAPPASSAVAPRRPHGAPTPSAPAAKRPIPKNDPFKRDVF